MRQEPLVHRSALAVLWLLILLYVANFGVLSVLQSAAFETSAADLGNMNQAAWYTLHLGYPADSFSGQPVTRFGGHVEPIFYLLALPYALRQTADMLLLIQVVVVALGAVAAYMLGRDVLRRESAGLLFALVYLFFPSLQAAVLTEFHPVALAAPFFLFAFYYLQKLEPLPFVVFALLAMSTKEDMSLLSAMLGLAMLVLSRLRSRESEAAPAAGVGARPAALAGLAVFVAGVAWFLATVYLIIPHFSASGANVLFERYSEVGGSPQGLVRTLAGDPLAVAGRLLAPEKLGYLGGLLFAGGFLALLAPWSLLLAAPSLGINMLSNYSPMYSGISHYSAPIAPFIIVGAVYGARRASTLLQTHVTWRAGRLTTLVLFWLLACATLYQILVGFTPLSLYYRVPRVGAHERQLERLTRQIPADAAVSALTPLHPHVSSRRLVYVFPTVQDATYVLLDVTARPTMHPNDLKTAVQQLIGNDGFGVVDAVDGYILLGRGVGQATLPDSFYDAFRTARPHPQYAMEVDFGGALRLLGFDIEDVDEGRQPWTRVRLYWQVSGALPDDLRIYPFYLDDVGNVIEDTTQRPMVASLWYAPARWRVGDTIRVQTLQWPLPGRFRLAVGVLRGNDWQNRSARLQAGLIASSIPLRPLDGATAVELGSFRRGLTRLALVSALEPLPRTQVGVSFGSELRLAGYDLHAPPAMTPGATVSITLYWQAMVRPATDYHTFVHIYDSSGRIAAQSDGVTGGDNPPTWWFPGQTISETHTITAPAAAASNLAQSLSVGVYDLQGGTRLPVLGRDGKPQGDAFVIPIAR